MNAETMANSLSFVYPSFPTQNLLAYQYQPLRLDETAPSFVLPFHQALITQGNLTASRDTFISLHDFLDYGQPLVIFFTGSSTRALRPAAVEALQQKVQQQGGKLLVLSPAEPKHLRRQLKEASLLSVFQDKDNVIAEAFGLYNDQNPLWQWVSGIEEEEETLSAFYVIAPDRTVAYRFVDFDFKLYSSGNYGSLAFMGEMLESVYHTSQRYHPARRYKLVS